MKKVFFLVLLLIILQMNNKRTETVFLDIDSNMDYYVVDISNLNITNRNIEDNIGNLKLMAVSFYINPIYSEKIPNYFYSINNMNEIDKLASKHLEKIRNYSINDYNVAYLNGIKINKVIVFTDNTSYIENNFRNSSYEIYRKRV